MRVCRNAIDTDALPWEALSDVLQRKVLNGDPESGAHTLLLRSGPREPGPSFAQYHPVDEELFCLAGDFTFDGSTWFHGGSYAFYPAYFVHGSRVHVRGGYEVYLRVSGVSELFTVDEPERDEPYYVGDGEAAHEALQLPDALQGGLDASDSAIPGLRLAPLHRDAATGMGSTILAATAAAQGRPMELETTGLLEIFTVSGAFQLAAGGRLGPHAYHCDVSERPTLSLVCEQAGQLMISHDGELRLRSPRP